jgi:DNA replication protein DnaC
MSTTIEEACQKLMKTVEASPRREQPSPDDSWKQLFEDSKAPKRHRNLGQRQTNPDWDLALHLLADKIGQGFLMALIGNRGAGKTQIAVEVMRESAKRFRKPLYCTAIEFFMAIKATYKKDSDDSEIDVIRKFRGPSLLVIDEISKRGETDWENHLLFELIDKRYQDCKDTLLISNQEADKFAESIGPSLVSRMNETGGIMTCNWEGFRQ